MKTRNLILVMLLVFGVAMSSCKKDEESANPITSSGKLSLKYAGTSWNASLAVKSINTNGVINVTGSDSEARQESVLLINVTAPGTYQITAASGYQLRWTEGLNPDQTYLANGILGSGSITVTEISNSSIKGTFAFEGYNTSGAIKSITDGVFEGSF